MNKTVKKTTALVISASMLLSLTACGDKAKDQVIEAAGSVAEALTSKKAKNYKGLLNEDAKKYDDHVETMDFFFEYLSEDIDDAQIYSAIIDTIEYEVDEESAEGSTKSAEGSVDVVFTYADAKKIAKNEDNTTDLDTFISAIKKAKDTTESTVTMEFELVDDEWLLTNFSDIEKFLEGLEVDVEFTKEVSYEDMISETSWWYVDDETTNTYNDKSFIELDVYVADEYYGTEWSYYFTVSYNGEVIYTSDTEFSYGSAYCYYSIESANCPTDENGWYMLPGTYEITLYDGNTNEVIFSDSCIMTKTETVVETTTAATTAASFDNLAGPGLDCFWATEDAIEAGSIDEPIYDEDSLSYFYDEDFYNSRVDCGWWDYDTTMTTDADGYPAYTTDTVTMAYSVEVEDGTTGSLYFEYYYSDGYDFQMIYSATINATAYTNGTYYDIEFSKDDGFAPGSYTVIVTDAAQEHMILYADVVVID